VLPLNIYHIGRFFKYCMKFFYFQSCQETFNGVYLNNIFILRERLI